MNETLRLWNGQLCLAVMVEQTYLEVKSSDQILNLASFSLGKPV